MKKLRLAWLATHPIQYQAPLLKAIARCADIELTALFFSDFSIRGVVDPGFGKAVAWDTPLLEGYNYEFLPGTGSEAVAIKTFQPRVNGLARRLNRDNYDAVLIQGWQHYGMITAAWLAKRAGLNVLMRCEATDHVNSSTGLKGKLREVTVRFLLHQVDACMAIGTRNREFYLKREFPADRIGSMPYCVDNDYFREKAQTANLESLRAKLKLEPWRPVILYASKFIKRKYPDHLLEAYHRLPEPRPYLVYVGDGEIRDSLEDAVRNRQLKDVRFVGFKNQGELPEFYALADIFVLPSINETWGLVINEAMNAGCAIITTDQVGSAADLVRIGENGFVIEPCNIEALKAALIACLEQDRFRSMGLRSMEIIKSWGINENVIGLRQVLALPNQTEV